MTPFEPNDILRATLELARSSITPSRLRLAVSKGEWEEMLAYLAKFDVLVYRDKLAVDRLEVNGIELVIDERL